MKELDANKKEANAKGNLIAQWDEKRFAEIAGELGLPTYPIYHEMPLRKRSPKEYQWLIDNGVFMSSYSSGFMNSRSTYVICKKGDNLYQLLRNDTYIPMPEAEAPTIEELIDAIRSFGLYPKDLYWCMKLDCEPASEDSTNT